MPVADPARSSPHLEHVLSINRLECQGANSKSAGVPQAGAFLYELHKASGGGWLDGGSALKGFWTAAVAVSNGKGPITYDWYRDLLNYLLAHGAYSWFAPLITFGELAVGLGLILGAMTGFAAFFGAFMNMSFELAGSASVNPVMFVFSVGLILAWKVAGYYGVDRWLLPLLGTPWARSSEQGKPGGQELRPTGQGV